MINHNEKSSSRRTKTVASPLTDGFDRQPFRPSPNGNGLFRESSYGQSSKPRSDESSDKLKEQFRNLHRDWTHCTTLVRAATDSLFNLIKDGNRFTHTMLLLLVVQNLTNFVLLLFVITQL